MRDALTWLAAGACAVLGGAPLAYCAARGLEKLRALWRAGWAGVAVAVVALVHGGAKNILDRFSADEGITVASAEFTRATNDVEQTYLVYSYTGADASQPLWVRQSVSNEWERLGNEWWYDDRIYESGTNTVTWFVNPPASNVFPHAMYWIGSNPPPVEIEESGGVEIVGFAMSAQGVAITYAVDGSVLHGKTGAISIEVGGADNAWTTAYSTNHAETVTNTFSQSGFFVDRLTRWRVRMEVEQ